MGDGPLLNESFITEEPDLDRVFQLPPTTYIGGEETSLTLKEIINRLEVLPSCYTATVSLTFLCTHLEFMLLLNSGLVCWNLNSRVRHRDTVVEIVSSVIRLLLFVFWKHALYLTTKSGRFSQGAHSLGEMVPCATSNMFQVVKIGSLVLACGRHIISNVTPVNT